MARKPKNDLEDDDLDFDFLDDEEYGGFDGEPIKDNRKPITRVAGAFKEGVTDKLKYRDFHKQVIKRALPDGYSQAITLGEDVSSSVADLYNTAARETRPAIRGFKRAMRKVMPEKPRFLPNKLGERISGWLDERDDTDGGEQTRAEAEEGEIALTIGEIFKIQAEEQSKRDQRGEIDNFVEKQIDKKRFETTAGTLAAIREGIDKQVGYQDSIVFQYQKKSLEVQLRHYYTARKHLESFEQYKEKALAELESTTKNTGLPEYVKVTNSEAAKKLARDKLFGKIGETARGKMKDILPGMMGNLSKVVKEKVEGFKDSLGQIEDLMTTLEDAQASGQSPEELAAGMMGGSVVEKLSKPLVVKLAKLANSSPKLVRGGYMAKTIAESPGQSLLDFKNSTVGDNVPIVGGFLRFLREIVPEVNEDMTIQRNPLESLDDGAEFNIRTQMTINRVIPGWLGRIHNELVKTRTGDDSIKPEVWDWKNGSFTTSKKLYSRAKEDLYSKSASEDFASRLEQFMEYIQDQDDDNEIKLTGDAKKAIEERVIAEALEGKEFTASRWIEGSSFRGESREVREEIEEFFRTIMKIQSADPDTLAFTKELMSSTAGPRIQNRLRRFSARVADAVTTPKDELIRMAEKEGLMETFLEEGDKTVKRNEDGSITFKSREGLEELLKKTPEGRKYAKSVGYPGFASGGAVRRQVPYGVVTGRGGPGEDKIRANIGIDEYVLPADTVSAVGQKNLDNLLDSTHTPEGQEDKTAGTSLKRRAVEGFKALIDKARELKFTKSEKTGETDKMDTSGDEETIDDTGVLHGARSFIKRILDRAKETADSLREELKEKVDKKEDKKEDKRVKGKDARRPKFSGIKSSKDVLSAVDKQTNVLGNLLYSIDYSLRAGIGGIAGTRLGRLGDEFTGMGKDALVMGGKAIGEGFKIAKGVGSIAKKTAYGIGGAAIDAAYGVFDSLQEKVSDIYVKGSDKVALTAKKLREGKYYDKAGKVITTLKELATTKGAIYTYVDGKLEVVLEEAEIAKGLITSKGKEVLDYRKGVVRKVFGAVSGGAINVGNLIRRVATSVAKTVTGVVFGARDVYVVGSKNPALRATIMREGLYFDKETLDVIRGIEDIKGPVVDNENNTVLSLEDLTQRGIVDAQGNPIRTNVEKIKGLISKSVGIPKDVLNASLAIGKMVKDKVSGFYKSIATKLSVMADGAGFGLFDVSRDERLIREVTHIRYLMEGRDPSEIEKALDDAEKTSKRIKPKKKKKDDVSEKIDKGEEVKAETESADDAANGSQSFTKTTLEQGENGKFRLVTTTYTKSDVGKDGKLTDEARERLKEEGKINGDNVADALKERAEAEREEERKKEEEESKEQRKLDRKNRKSKIFDQDGSGHRDGGWRDIFASRKNKKVDTSQKVVDSKGKSQKEGSTGWLGSIIGMFGGAVSGLMGGIDKLSSVGGVIGTAATVLGNTAKILGGSIKLAYKAISLGARGAGWVATKALPGIGKAAWWVGKKVLGGALRAGLAMVSSPVLLTGAAIGLAAYGGYKLYKHLTRDHETILGLRMMQYGVELDDESRINTVSAVEKMAIDATRITGGNIQITQSFDVKKLPAMFGIKDGDNEGAEQLMKWLVERFRPVYVAHATAMHEQTGDFNLLEADKLKGKQRRQYMTHITFNGDDTPYEKTASPWSGEEELTIKTKSIKTYTKRLHHRIKDQVEKDKSDDLSEKDPIDKKSSKTNDTDTESKETLKTPGGSFMAAAGRLAKEALARANPWSKRNRFDLDQHIIKREDGVATNDQWQWPAPGRISSAYGMRVHPVTGSRRNHNGVDVAAPEGTPIRAAYDGVITVMTYTRAGGNTIYIDHRESKLQTRYAHMQRFQEGLSVGNNVVAGQIIGYVGNTGRSTGPHLHFGMYKLGENGKAAGTIDPVAHISRKGAPTAKSELGLRVTQTEEIKKQAAKGLPDATDDADEKDTMEGEETIISTVTDKKESKSTKGTGVAVNQETAGGIKYGLRDSGISKGKVEKEPIIADMKGDGFYGDGDDHLDYFDVGETDEATNKVAAKPVEPYVPMGPPKPVAAPRVDTPPTTRTYAASITGSQKELDDHAKRLREYKEKRARHMAAQTDRVSRNSNQAMDSAVHYLSLIHGTQQSIDNTLKEIRDIAISRIDESVKPPTGDEPAVVNQHSTRNREPIKRDRDTSPVSLRTGW